MGYTVNLRKSSRCLSFPPAKVKRTADRLEIYFTRLQRCGLNIAEIDIDVIVRQRLSQRIPERDTMCGRSRPGRIGAALTPRS